MMEKEDCFSTLEKFGFYGRGLFKVSEPEMVERYNLCLKEIGLEPTSLTEFRIDGIGYSPEIAAEKDNLQYLSQMGVSNPYAIIMSPDQKGLPIYNPFFSFHEEVMEEAFNKFQLQIEDLTLRTGLTIDLDEGLTRIVSPDDLLLIEWLVLKFHVIGPIAAVAQRQREIASSLLQEENWADQNMIEELSANITLHGDLRYARTQLTNLPFTDIRSYYTSAFGGVYIFRDITDKPVLVHVQSDDERRTDNQHAEYHLSDPDLYDRLLEHGMIELYPERYRDVEKLSQLADCMLAGAIANHDEEIDLMSMSTGQKKKYALDLIDKGILSAVYDELSRLAHLSQRDRVSDLENASYDLRRTLAHPHKKVKGLARSVVHRLLAHMNPVNVFTLYAYGRESFYQIYQTWPKNQQVWAAYFLKDRYVSPYKITEVLQQSKSKKRRKS